MTNSTNDTRYLNPQGLRHRSDAVIHGGVAYLAGVVANQGSDITTQTQDVLATIDQQLALAGTDKSRLLTATIWLTDLTNVKAFNAVWTDWVAPSGLPARACVQAGLQGDTLLEIVVTAAAGPGTR